MVMSPEPFSSPSVSFLDETKASATSDGDLRSMSVWVLKLTRSLVVSASDTLPRSASNAGLAALALTAGMMLSASWRCLSSFRVTRSVPLAEVHPLPLEELDEPLFPQAVRLTPAASNTVAIAKDLRITARLLCPAAPSRSRVSDGLLARTPKQH